MNIKKIKGKINNNNEVFLYKLARRISNIK